MNADSITIGELIGKKVVLVDFMTYSCINCQRTFPYLNAWYKKYKDQGLEIVSIHTLEFAFEKDIGNVRWAMVEFGITHPVVLENDYATRHLAVGDEIRKEYSRIKTPAQAGCVLTF